MITNETQLNRFTISLKDFEKAIQFLEEAKNHQINTLVYESLIFAAIVCYFRPFSPNEKAPNSAAISKLDLSDFLPLAAAESLIHERCKELRNKALAHSEIKYHPTSLDRETGVIASKLFSLVGNTPDLDQLIELSRKLSKQCHNKRADYVYSVSGHQAGRWTCLKK